MDRSLIRSLLKVLLSRKRSHTLVSNSRRSSLRTLRFFCLISSLSLRLRRRMRKLGLIRLRIINKSSMLSGSSSTRNLIPLSRAVPISSYPSFQLGILPRNISLTGISSVLVEFQRMIWSDLSKLPVVLFRPLSTDFNLKSSELVVNLRRFKSVRKDTICSQNAQPYLHFLSC